MLSLNLMKQPSHTIDRRNENWFNRVFYLYYDGFRSMTVGKTLWLIIGIKIVVFFVILRFIFFPNFLNGVASDDEGKAQYVREQLTKRG